ncbi:hypothetical protein Tco_1549023 [Tanacetum coccineum]
MMLRKSMDVFVWEPADMTGIPRKIIEHSLNVNPSTDPLAQKRRVLASDRTHVVIKDVEEWMNAGIVHLVQMAKEDEEKTAFYTEQGTYCYTKMPFGLKNAGATYQSNDEKVLIADIAETFDYLWRINMKLNPNKCSFGVGKFLGYMVTSERIRDNPKKTKAIANMQSPRTLKGMQSLSGKLVALKRFLSRSVEKLLPFFETLKDITKENKDEYRWTESAEKAFQEMKKVIVELPLLTAPVKEETLYVYVAAATKAEIIKVFRGSSHRSHNGPATQADTKQGSSVKKAGQVLGGIGIIQHNLLAKKCHKRTAKVQNKDDIKKWTLLTDGASNNKGSRAGLVLISPSGVEFTYALRLNFTSMNNEAE